MRSAKINWGGNIRSRGDGRSGGRVICTTLVPICSQTTMDSWVRAAIPLTSARPIPAQRPPALPGMCYDEAW